MRTTSSCGRGPRLQGARGRSFAAGGFDSAGFPGRVARLLRAANPALEYRNLAVAGARTPEVVAGQLEPALELEPDVVTLVCGGNDALLAIRPDVRAHTAALERALGALRGRLPHAEIATATTPDPARFVPLRPR